MSKVNYWNPEFTPSYTPMQMIELGVFEGIYTGCIKNIPAELKKHKNVLKCGSEPDIELNHFKVKSRQSLKVWQEKGWTTEHSPLGWWEWYIKYFYGRRLDKEDEMQINRWKSFVARHNAQVQSKCKKGDKSCNTKQRQALLQWGWDSNTVFDDKQREKNLNKLKKLPEVSLESNDSGLKSLEW